MKQVAFAFFVAIALTLLCSAAGASEVVIISHPPTVATIGETYLYDVDAVSNEPGDQIRFSLKKKPSGMVIDEWTGEIEWVPSGTGTFEVEVRAQGNSSGSGSGHDDQRFWISVLNGEPSMLVGLVRNELGAMVPDMRLRLFEVSSGHFVFRTESDSLGEFSFPNVNPGQYLLRVSPRHSSVYASQWYDRARRLQDATPIDIPESSQVSIVVTLQFKDSMNIEFQISGTVRDSAGSPLEDAKVSVFRARDGGDFDNSGFNFRGLDDDDRNGRHVKTVRTDSLGNYSVSLKPRTYVLRAAKQGFDIQWWDHKNSLPEADRLSLTRDTTSINFDLQPRALNAGIIRGRVSDQDSLSVNAHVLGLHRSTPTGRFTGFVRHAETDSSGLYELSSLRSGYYIILAIPIDGFLPTFYDTTGGTQKLSHAFPVRVFNSLVDNIHITVPPDTISGTNRIRGVISSSGIPVAGALVFALSNGTAVSSALSYGDGSFSIPGLRPGAYRVEVMKPNFYDQLSQQVALQYSGIFPTTASVQVELQHLSTEVEQQGNGLPGAFILEQNFPNPFNPSTTILFGIPTAGVVRLSVFDLLGREVTTLVQEHLPAGSYNVRWDARSHSSGIYFYTLESQGRRMAKRMLLVK